MEDTKRKDRIAELYQALKKKNKYLSQINLDQPLEDPLQTISNIYDNTFLHLAIRFKQKDMIEELLMKLLPKEGNPPLWNIKNKEGNTILHELACSDSMENLAQEALKICKDKDSELLTARNELGETPIFCAARHGQTEMFKFLAEKMKLKVGSVEDVMPEEMKLKESLELLNSQQHLQRDDKTTVLHISITTECFGLAEHIADSYSFLINEKDQDSMTALQYFACSSSAFGMQEKRGRELIVAFIKSKSNQKQGCIDIIRAAIKELRDSGWSIAKAMKKKEGRMHCKKLAQILVAVDTSWDASGDDQNTVETTSELSQKQEGKISPGSTSTSEYNTSVENPLLLATISNIPEIVKAILNCQPQVLEHTSKKCEENPLFLATISNIPEIIKAILDRYPQALEQTNKKSHEDPLFLATISNIPQIVRQILIVHPQAIEHTNKEGMNILHVAILYRRNKIFDMVVEEFEVLSRRLLSATDNKGNSLLHMFGQKGKSQIGEKMQNPAFQLRRELLSFEKVKKACQVHVTKLLNKDNKTAEELFATRNEKLHKEATEWLMRTTENCTLLSVFIATVAFAAAYTVPGGPDQNTGIPILNCKPFFVVFIIADVISLTLALTSVGIFLTILQSSFLLEDFEKYLFDKLIQGIKCLMFSVLMMAVAFGATIILIMKHNWKKTVWHVVAFLPVPIFFLSYSPLRSVLRTDIKKLFKKVLKSIEVVALVALVALVPLVALIFLLGFIIGLCRGCMELLRTVAKACGYKSQPKSDTQSQQTAAQGAEV